MSAMKSGSTVKEAPRLKHHAYVWCRQFSRERLEVLSGILFARRWWLDEGTAALSAFSRLQIGNTDKWHNVSRSVDGVWEGRDVDFTVVIRPLFIRYAVEVFRRALGDTLAHYPNFTRVAFEDGPLIGERRIIFPDRLDEAATTWLHGRFWELATNGDIRVAEGFSVCFEDAEISDGRRAKGRFEIDLDRGQMNEETWREVRDALSAGKIPMIDPSPRRCDPLFSIGLLQHLSIPELFALNWEACLPPLSDADCALTEAAGKLDTTGIRKALASGANPNCFGKKYAQTPLGLIVVQTARCPGDEEYSENLAAQRDALALEAIDCLVESGAAVDLAGFNESTPLDDACLNSSARIITGLLEHGADPSILCYDDDELGAWGGAWDSASYRNDPDVYNNDSSAWDALLEFWPAPYDGVRVKEKDSS